MEARATMEEVEAQKHARKDESTRRLNAVYDEAALAQRVTTVAHRRDEQRNARLVAPHPARLAGRFDHQHAVVRRVEPLEGGAVQAELVSEHQHELTHRVAHGRGRVR